MDKKVYAIPCLFMIGWRGEPGTKDEPQHLKQGEVTCQLLESMNIPYSILPEDISSANEAIENALRTMKKDGSVYALLVKNGTFEKSDTLNKKERENDYPLREDVIRYIEGRVSENDVIVSTTGKTSRELFELREISGKGHGSDFLTVGSMGHASQISLGIALNKKERKIFCLDGDGALIMHMGGMAVIGQIGPKNYKHIVLNNGAHESVGGQPTAGFSVDICAIAKACGYKYVVRVASIEELKNIWAVFYQAEGPSLLEVFIKKGSRNNLGRPTLSPIENKESFMRGLN